jgi:two-component system OmpR family response regulator
MRTREERILLVEDEEPIRDLVTTALRFIGFTVETAATGPEGLALARNDAWHVLVLDVNLPGLDGFSLCRKLREAGDEVPVIFLTARDDPADLREGFTGGGDDYLTKPFSLEELVLHVEAMLRRGRGQANDRARVAVGDVVLDDDAHRVWRGDQEIAHSPTEYRLLRYLLWHTQYAAHRPPLFVG